MISVKDTKTGKTFEVEDAHWENVLVRVDRYEKAEKKPLGRPKKAVEAPQEDIEE